VATATAAGHCRRSAEGHGQPNSHRTAGSSGETPLLPWRRGRCVGASRLRRRPPTQPRCGHGGYLEQVAAAAAAPRQGRPTAVADVRGCCHCVCHSPPRAVRRSGNRKETRGGEWGGGRHGRRLPLTAWREKRRHTTFVLGASSDGADGVRPSSRRGEGPRAGLVGLPLKRHDDGVVMPSSAAPPPPAGHSAHGGGTTIACRAQL